MFQSLHAIRQSLADLRAQTESEIRERATDAAAGEVLDELDRRLRNFTDTIPANTPNTKTTVTNHGDDIAQLTRYVVAVVREMGRLSAECAETVHELRHPAVRLIGRIESEGYAVDDINFTHVSDARDWSIDALDGPHVQVQLDAERIARTEQATVYQQRLERMDAAVKATRDQYAQRIRQLPHTVQVAAPQRTSPPEPRKNWHEGLPAEVIHALKTGELPPEPDTPR